MHAWIRRPKYLHGYGNNKVTIITWNTESVAADQLDRFNDAVFSLINKSAVEAANSLEKKFKFNKVSFLFVGDALRIGSVRS